MEDTASEYFGAMVAEYDSLLRRAVPRYQEMIDRAVEYIPPGKTRVLELGCGTGNYTLAVAERLPSARLTLLDGSQEMLDCAQERLEAGGDVECRQGKFEELSFPPGSFDLVTSCISMHHVTDMKALFASIFEVLEPGGHLLFADQMRGGTEPNHALNIQRMEDFWRRPGHLTPEEQHSLAEHSELHDHHVSVPAQLRWLDEVGYTDLDCVWRNWMWGVLVARKPS